MKLFTRVFLTGSFICLGYSQLWAGETKSAPKELVQYVRDATKLGLKDTEIERNATAAGWPAPQVKAAIASLKSSASENAAPPDTASAATGTQPTPPASAPPPAPASPPAASVPSVPTNVERLQRGVPDNYIIGEGDTLQISVYKEPDASVPNTVVLPNGEIALPLIKRIQVAGLTPLEAEKSIGEQLGKFIPGADVTVIISGAHSKRIYMIGAVKKEGPIPYTYRMTIMQAISEAGGLTDYAKRKKIYVLRTENGKEFRLPFDYDAVLRGERMELNIPLFPNDTLVVPH